MPVSGRIPRLVEGGTNGLTDEAGTLSGTRLLPIGRRAFWTELVNYWKEWWRPVASRACPGVFSDCSTASLASGEDGLRPTLWPVFAPWSREPNGAVTWRWPCRRTWSTPSTALPGQDMQDLRVSSGTRVSTGCGPGISLGPKHHLHRPGRGGGDD